MRELVLTRRSGDWGLEIGGWGLGIGDWWVGEFFSRKGRKGREGVVDGPRVRGTRSRADWGLGIGGWGLGY